jgi:L,D-transpeptidase ErfK/SrfK
MVKVKIFRFYFLILFGFVLLGGCATRTGMNLSEASSEVSNVYPMPENGNNIIGKIYQVKVEKGMTFDEMAQHFNLGAQELKDANPDISPRRIHVGSMITIPTEFILPPKKFQKGIVINIAERRLYYFNKGNHTVLTFPIAIGRQGWHTPLGSTYVYRKEEGPIWNVPKSIRDAYLEKNGEEHPRRIGPGPQNPLGEYAIYLHMDGYLIHGTNSPASIGNSVSSGCIRMHNSDVAELYNHVKRGTPVNIIYYPNKAGWRDGKLYLESHRLTSYQSNGATTAAEEVLDALKERPGTVNWQMVKKVVKQHRGLPTEIGTEKVL